jgi:hypothetical protein
MKSAANFALLFLLAVVLVKGEEKSPEMKQCIKERRRGLVSIKKKIDICQTAVSTSSGDETAIRGCLAKCVFKKENALDDNDALTKESFENAIENRVSGGQRELLVKSFEECLEEHGTLVKPEEETCPGYEKVGVCLQSALESLCDDPEALSPRADADGAKEEL